MIELLRYFLPIYLLTYFGVAFVLPSYRVWKKTGVNPVTFRGSATAHDYIGKLFKVVMAGLALVVIVFAFVPNVYSYLLPVFWLESDMTKFIGIGLLLLSLAWTVVAQIQMGNSWRIGIDEEKRTGLVQTGVFGISRNPIFLGMIITLIGFFLTIPNAVTLLVMFLGFVLMQIQVRLEEEFLTKIHGLLYEGFRGRVRRWL